MPLSRDAVVSPGAPPRARRRGRPPLRESLDGKSTRDRLLDAAAELFARKGYDATSVDAIAERAGLTVGALYRHFSGKGELLLDVMRHALTALPIAHHMRGDRGRAELLPEMVALYIAPSARQLRQITVELHRVASRDRRVGRMLREFSERMARDTRTRIETGRAQGMIVADHDADLAARLLMVLIAGLTHLDTLYPQLAGDAAWRDLVQKTVRWLLGIETPPGRRS
ncbi:MAG TPA: helix-turn-helix domain-containing protein [Candidatus Binataceae bacterium]|jgi:AcrR family transcriptional regulator|nr:helix-turn-helix domain-containing protein [Candidatus Binataceae bacterium]